MFNIGMMELFVVLLVAFLIVGPKDLPKVARWIARQIKTLRKLWKDVRKEIGWDEFAAELKDTKRELDDTLREADVTAEMRQVQQDVQSVVEDVRREVDEAAQQTRTTLDA